MDKYIIGALKCKGIGPAKLLKFLDENNFDPVLIKKNFQKFITKDYDIDMILDKATNEIRESEKYGINLITIMDKKFPRKLYKFNSPILYLYYKGNINLINERSIGIVGTREPQSKTVSNIEQFVSMFKDEKIVTISGLAIGVDSIAHKNSLKNSIPTLAVLPSDLKNIQPTKNTELADTILRSGGCLVSEYPIGTQINNYNYAQRNRIQSALSDVLIVPEAGEKSGTMITINYSLKNGKPIFQFIDNNLKNIDKVISPNDKHNLSKIKNEIENYNRKIQLNVDDTKIKQIQLF